MAEFFDLLVVGIGPGGASAARQAAAAGLKVLAIDKKRCVGEPVQCAEFLPSPMIGYACARGALVQRVAGMKSYLPSGAVEVSDFPGLMIDRAKFDRALAALAQRAGAVVRTGARIASLNAEQNTARIHAGADRATLVRYRALIAADGPRSPVARLLGLPALPVIHTRQYTVPLRRPYVHTDIWLSNDFPGGYGWLFPKGGQANVGMGADRGLGGNPKRRLDRLHTYLVQQAIVGNEILYRTGGPIPVGGMRARLVWGNVVFVGDAAGLTHPITGAGIAAAVQSGERAGEIVARFLAGGGDAALAAYDEEMREQYGPTLARALERRAYLAHFWCKAAANDDWIHRKGWIAFKEYFE